MEGLDDPAELHLIGSWERSSTGSARYAEAGVTDFRLEVAAPDAAARESTRGRPRRPPDGDRSVMATPAGYHTLTPRIVVADVDAQVAWLRSVFGATGDVVAGRPAEFASGTRS